MVPWDGDWHKDYFNNAYWIPVIGTGATQSTKVSPS